MNIYFILFCVCFHYTTRSAYSAGFFKKIFLHGIFFFTMEKDDFRILSVAVCPGQICMKLWLLQPYFEVFIFISITPYLVVAVTRTKVKIPFSSIYALTILMKCCFKIGLLEYIVLNIISPKTLRISLEMIIGMEIPRDPS